MNKTEARELISKGFKSLTASSKSYQEKVHLDFIKDHLEKKKFSHVASYISLPHEVICSYQKSIPRAINWNLYFVTKKLNLEKIL